MATIGQNIKKRREALNLTQDDLAALVGYTSRSSITRIEQDALNLPQTKIAAIAKALGCKISDLLDGSENQILELDPFTGIKAILKVTKSQHNLPFDQLPQDIKSQIIGATISAVYQYYDKI